MNYHIIYSVPGTGGLTYARKALLQKLRFINERSTSVLSKTWGRYKNWAPKGEYKVGKFIETLNTEIGGGSFTDTIIYGPGVSKHPMFFNDLAFVDSIKRYYVVPQDFGVEENSVLATRSTDAFLAARSKVYSKIDESNRETFTEKYKLHILNFYNNIADLNLTFSNFESFNYEGGNLVISDSGKPAGAGEFASLKMAIVG